MEAFNIFSDMKNRAEEILSNYPEALVSIMEELYKFKDLEQSRVLRRFGVHRNTLNYWLHKSKRFSRKLQRLIEEEGRGRGKRLRLSDEGRRVISELIKEKRRRALPTFRNSHLGTPNGETVPYIKCKAMPAEKIENTSPAIPVFFGGSGIIPLRPSSDTMLQAYCGTMVDYSGLPSAFRKFERCVDEIHGGIRRQSWTLRLSGVIWPVGEEMEYILGISANDLSNLIGSQNLKYKAYVGWIIETYDDITYVVGGLFGHLIEATVYLPYIPENHTFAVIDTEGSVESKTRRMYFTETPKGQYIHLGARVIESGAHFIKEKTITFAKPQYYILIDGKDDFKQTYSILPEDPQQYTSTLYACENGFAKLLASFKPSTIFTSTIVDKETLQNRMRVLSISATVVRINIGFDLTLYSIKTRAGLVYTKE